MLKVAELAGELAGQLMVKRALRLPRGMLRSLRLPFRRAAGLGGGGGDSLHLGDVLGTLGGITGGTVGNFAADDAWDVRDRYGPDAAGAMPPNPSIPALIGRKGGNMLAGGGAGMGIGGMLGGRKRMAIPGILALILGALGREASTYDYETGLANRFPLKQ